MERYRSYSDYLKGKYGEKTYKLPVSLDNTCPNRDGKVSTGGCTFCSEIGAGFEMHSCSVPVKEQIKTNMELIKEKYKANRFIVYFQNFTNTYMEMEAFKKSIESALEKDVVEIAISTRPDCINDEILGYLKTFSQENKVEISIELGLQTVNYKTLEKINRGHTLAEFIDAVLRIKSRGFEICAHVILNLPWDEHMDAVESAKIISALGIGHVKLHSLYIAKGTVMAQQYEKGEFEIIGPEEYIQRMVDFVRHLSPDIVIQRLFARAPKEETVFCNWNMSWWKLRDMFDEKMQEGDYHQGDLFDYLGGKALR